MKKGFTLVELLIVIAIIGILTGIVIASTTSARGAARDARRLSDLKEIQLSLALYFDVNKSYPTSAEGLAKLVASDQKYLAAVPTDPQTHAAYEYVPSANNKSYCLGAKLEGSIPNDSSFCSLSGGSTANYKVSR